LTANIPGKDPQVVGSVEIRADAPRIINVVAARTSDGLRVEMTGYSTERRMLSVDFDFRVRIGTALQDVTLTRSVQTDFDNWYRNTTSAPFGSSFVFSQSFTVQGNVAAIESVSVKLTNGAGSTTSSLVPFPN
jgi:hypothetical protein